MKQRNGQLWKIWVLGTIIVIASMILMLLCIVTKPSSVTSTAVSNVEETEKKDTPIIEENIEQSAPIIQNSAQVAESFPLPNTANANDAQEIAEENTEEPKVAAVTPKSVKVHKFDIPAAVNGATLIFIFDDAGQSLTKLQKYTAKMPFPFTVAVLPYLPHSRDCALELSKKGKEIMLHQPMQAVNLSINPGPGAILPEMDSYSIEEQLRKNIDSLGVQIAGMNNHEGSLITSDLVKMLDVLQVVKEKDIYFLDSRTTSATKAPQAAQLLGLTIFSNDVFLDNEVERNAILKQIYRGLTVANKNGKAVMIGHIDKSSDIIPKLLSEMYGELVDNGYRFSTLSMYK